MERRERTVGVDDKRSCSLFSSRFRPVLLFPRVHMDVDTGGPENLPSEWETRELGRLARADRRMAGNQAIPYVLVGSGTDEHRQHQELWFDDGNVVLVAGNTWFKLYRGILARYSSVFRDLFQVADASAGDTIQNCPVVHVTDNPDHLVLFFVLMYDGARQYVTVLSSLRER